MRWILVIIFSQGYTSGGIRPSYIYQQSEAICKEQAEQIAKNKIYDVKVTTFCMKGMMP
jgi:hypothetical protein